MEEDNNPINLYSLINLVEKNFKVFVVIFFTTFSLFMIYSLFMPHKFESSIVIFPANNLDTTNANDFSAITSSFGFELPNAQNPEVQKYETSLESKKFLIGFIKSNNFKQVMYPDLWNSKKSQWKRNEPTDEESYNLFVKDFFSLQKDSLTGVFTITITTFDGNQAADMANKLINEFNDYIREGELYEINRNIEFLNERVNDSRLLNTSSYLYNLIEAQTTELMIASVRKQFAFLVLDPAIPPDSRSSPVRSDMAISSIILSIFLSLIYLLWISIAPQYLLYRNQVEDGPH
jgi:capsule polysaccharide export protein KpsE/RkpR